MKHIYKYDITEHLTLGNKLTIPCGAKFLSVQIDPKNGHVCAWYMVDTSNPSESIKVHIFETGKPLPSEVDYMKYRGTLITPLGLVGHVFEERT